ncbi:MAG: hypothetical protein CEE38_07930 [Planctomycetes bacterium B3_Pla]|nr:MAG: hypothetical protein CEE38_07930 [Planctomycetes bacterium B3_Pla]
MIALKRQRRSLCFLALCREAWDVIRKPYIYGTNKDKLGKHVILGKRNNINNRVRPYYNYYKRIVWRWIAVLVFGTTFMRANVAEGAGLDDLVGEWAVSVDLSGVPQLAKLNVIETGPIPKAKLTSTFGEADVRSIAREGENYLVSYDVEFGEERLDVKLSLTLENDTLSGNVATGLGEMAMEWPVSGARVGTSAESDLRTVVETMSSRMENKIAVTGPTLPVGDAEEYLGSWLLDISWADKVGKGSSDAELLVVEDEGKVVAGLWARGKPLGIFYEISKSEKGLSWPIELRFGDVTIELTMEISLEDERLVGTWADEDEIAFVLSGVKRPAGEMSSISEDLLRQKPNVELVGVIAGPARVVDVKDHEVYVQEGTDLTILNVMDPLLVRFKLCNLQERNHAVSVIDSTVYAVKRTSGLFQVFDISDQSAPRIVGSCRVPRNTPVAVAAKGSLVFAANTQQLHIIDISEPSTPTLLTSYDTTRGSRTYDIAVSGSNAIVAAAGGLRIIDVSKPRTPALLSTFKGRARWNRGVDISGSMAYIASSMAKGASSLQIVDISDPSAPVQVGSYETPGVAQDVAVLGTLAFVADREAGLEVIDVSDPANPIGAGFYRTRMYASKVAVSEQLTFMSLRNIGLIILRYDSRN